jgi:hypothetical protein
MICMVRSSHVLCETWNCFELPLGSEPLDFLMSYLESKNVQNYNFVSRFMWENRRKLCDNIKVGFSWHGVVWTDSSPLEQGPVEGSC